MTKRCKISMPKSTKKIIQSWYPWITNKNNNVLDRNLCIKLEKTESLTQPEALVALKWYQNIPNAFKSFEDLKTAMWLHDEFGASLKR